MVARLSSVAAQEGLRRLSIEIAAAADSVSVVTVRYALAERGREKARRGRKRRRNQSGAMATGCGEAAVAAWAGRICACPTISSGGGVEI